LLFEHGLWKIQNILHLLKRKYSIILQTSKENIFIFRASKLLDEKYIEVKKTFELGKAHLSHTEHRVFLK
jgi:hypothetical protein